MSHRHSDSDKIKQITGIAALSAGIGALVALLFAPKSGSDIRNQIGSAAKNKKASLKNRAKTVEVSDDVQAMTATIEDSTAEVAVKAKDAATQAKSTINEKLSDLKKEAKDINDDIKK